MSVLESILLLVLAAAIGVALVFYRLENLLKGYQGEGDIGLLRGLPPWRPHLLVQLSLAPGERVYALDGLPPERIYDVALSLPAAAAEPGRLRLEARNHDRIYTVADSASAGWVHSGPHLWRLAGQGSFPVRAGDRWRLTVVWEPAASTDAELLVTSMQIR